METLYTVHSQILSEFEATFSRDLQEDIDWNERLLFIKGARGIGKTTLILQHILQVFGFDKKALYVSMDNINMADKRIIDIAKYHNNQGGTHLFIDEIHKYENWSQELKNIYDTYKKLRVVVSGSSILHLYKGNADLSRRGIAYELNGLSLREYLNIQNKLNLQKYSLEDILKNHVKIANQILKEVNPLQYFKEYLSHGYYPFYLEGTRNFHQKLNQTINQTIENDIPQLFHLELNNINKIKKLLYHIATSVPFQPNTTKLAESMELSRPTLNTYLQYMHEAKILQLLWDSTKAYTLISKPEKIYLQNPNLCHLVLTNSTNLGNLRETFFMNQLANNNYTVYSAKKSKEGGKQENNAKKSKEVFNQLNDRSINITKKSKEDFNLLNDRSINITKKSKEDFNQLNDRSINITKKSKEGDFLVNDKYIFEVGGEGKSFKQIADIKNSYLALDNELIGAGNRIPLWLFGFLG
jgi:uncharacterized protein